MPVLYEIIQHEGKHVVVSLTLIYTLTLLDINLVLYNYISNYRGLVSDSQLSCFLSELHEKDY